FDRASERRGVDGKIRGRVPRISLSGALIMATVQIERPEIQPVFRTNNHHLAKTMLQSIERLHTRYVCSACGQALMLSNMFAIDEIRTLMRNLTGSCPNCRHVLSFSPEKIRFLHLSA